MTWPLDVYGADAHPAGCDLLACYERKVHRTDPVTVAGVTVWSESVAVPGQPWDTRVHIGGSVLTPAELRQLMVTLTTLAHPHGLRVPAGAH